MLKAAVDEAYKNGYFSVVILRGTIHRVQSIASQNQQITTGLSLQLFWNLKKKIHPNLRLVRCRIGLNKLFYIKRKFIRV